MAAPKLIEPMDPREVTITAIAILFEMFVDPKALNVFISEGCNSQPEELFAVVCRAAMALEEEVAANHGGWVGWMATTRGQRRLPCALMAAHVMVTRKPTPENLSKLAQIALS